jgi:hypothetical protein
VIQIHSGVGYSRHKQSEHIDCHHRRYRITEPQLRSIASGMFDFSSRLIQQLDCPFASALSAGVIRCGRPSAWFPFAEFRPTSEINRRVLPRAPARLKFAGARVISTAGGTW